MAILGISGKKTVGKDTVGKIIQILTQSPHFNNEAVVKFLRRKIIEPTFNIKKFADSLKDMLCILIGCTREQLEDREFKEKELPEQWWYWYMKLDGGYGTIMLDYLTTTKEQLSMYEGLVLVKPTPRLLLQLLGTEAGRDIIHPNLWVIALFSDYKPVTGMHGFNPLDHDLSKGVYNALVESMYPNWVITDMRFPNELEAVKRHKGVTIRVNRLSEYQKFQLTKIRAGRINNIAEEIIKSEHPSETALDNATFDYVIDNNGTIEELIQKVRIILQREKII